MEQKPQINLIHASKEGLEWKQDPKGYFLIEPRPSENLIYLHHYDNDNSYVRSISGENTIEIYYTILKLELVSTLQHAAYLGAEIQKAEEAMKTNKPYIQDRRLN